MPERYGDDRGLGGQGPAGDGDDDVSMAGQYGGWAHEVGEIVKAGEEAGRDMGRLKQMRRALDKAKQNVREAEERGRRQGLQEQLTPEVRAELHQEIRQELQGETARARNVARLGVPAELESLFPDDLGDDFSKWQQRATELHARGISWGDAPLVRQVASQQLQAATQAATHAAGNGQVDLGQPGVPPEVQDRLVAEAVGQMAGAAAGAQPPGTQSPLEEQIAKGQRNPGLLMDDNYRDSLTDHMNRELDALSRGHRPEIGGF